MTTKEINESEGLRTPAQDEYSDFNQAWQVSKTGEYKKEDIKHMHACVFGENDGPDWIWILEFKTGDFHYLKAGCDFTGWDCRASGNLSDGYSCVEDAIAAIPQDYDVDEAKRALLLLQARGEKPYGLS